MARGTQGGRVGKKATTARGRSSADRAVSNAQTLLRAVQLERAHENLLVLAEVISFLISIRDTMN